MSHHGAPALEPMCNTGANAIPGSATLRSGWKSLQPPTVVKPHDFSRLTVASAQALESA
jgi:hypothetical protein